MAYVIAFGSSCKQYIATRVIYCLPRCSESFECNRQFEEWTSRIPRGILNGQTRRAGGNTSSHASSYSSRSLAISGREVGINWQIDSSGNLSDVLKGLIERNGGVGIRKALGKRETGAGRR
jgi:hypothetical protein